MSLARPALVADIEADGLQDASRVWCIAVSTLGGRQRWRFHDDPGLERSGTVAQGAAFLNRYQDRGIVFHNGQEYDAPTLRRLLGVHLRRENVWDSLIAARMAFPDVKRDDARAQDMGRYRMTGGMARNPHALASWGVRLGHRKLAFGEEEGDWLRFTERMMVYCEGDVEVTRLLMLRCLPFLGDGELAGRNLEVETEFAENIRAMCDRGVRIHRGRLEELTRWLCETLAGLAEEVQDMIPPGMEPYFTEKRRDPRMREVVFNPGSRKQIVEWLRRTWGWVPTEYTEPSKTFPEGQPKMDESILRELDCPGASLLADYLHYGWLLGNVSTGDRSWEKSIQEDGRIHSRVLHIGAPSHRCSHSSPNYTLAGKVERVGPRFRACWVPAEGYRFVGCDAANLELRCLAHRLACWDGGAYARAVLEGRKEDGTDAHSLNTRAMKLVPPGPGPVPSHARERAKIGFYCTVYGGGPTRFAKEVSRPIGDAPAEKIGVARARRMQRDLLRGIVGFEAFVKLCKGRAKDPGRVMLVDGRRVPARAQHSATNTVLQGDGAIVMKWATNNVCRGLRDAGIEGGMVLHAHDEYQLEVVDDPEAGRLAEELAEAAVAETTEQLGLRCPMAGEARSGMSWAETH